MGRRISTRKKLAFTAILLLLLWPVCELIAFVGLKVAIDDFSLERLHAQRGSLARGAVSDGAAEAYHPFVGWCFDPNVAEPVTFGDRTIGINELGFLDDNPSLAQRSDDEFILGIAGGSVAWQVSVDGEDTLREKLEASPLLAGRKLRLVRMAMSGYKQPQQVMTLSYLLSLGGEFDAVVNLDGYNETALTVAENDRADVSYAYPRAWNTRTAAMVNPRDSADSAALLAARGQRQSMARSLRTSVLRFSPLANAVWKLRDDACRQSIYDLSKKLSKSTRDREEQSFASYGPQNPYENDDERDTAIIDLWIRSSVLMDRICRGHNCVYVHMLQANQYHTRSKPMSEQEKKDSILATQRAGQAVEKLYPKLIKAAYQLDSEGVQFSDQTQLFAEIVDPIYCDGFCHYNKRGNQMMAEQLADRVLKALAFAQD